MLFDYLVGIIAQKLAFVNLLKFEKKLKKLDFLNFFNFSIFSNFKETYKSDFLSYDCNQVVKKHLNYLMSLINPPPF